MKIQDVMSGKLISVSPEESVAVAARLLSRYNIGALPVCSREGRLRGMVTDRDIVLRCVAAGEDPQKMRISELMTRRVVSIGAEEEAKTAADLMAREQLRRLPVERGGRVVGMVSLGDFASHPGMSAQVATALGQISSNVRHL